MGRKTPDNWTLDQSWSSCAILELYCIYDTSVWYKFSIFRHTQHLYLQLCFHENSIVQHLKEALFPSQWRQRSCHFFQPGRLVPRHGTCSTCTVYILWLV
jgi:hypothetical protein